MFKRFQSEPKYKQLHTIAYAIFLVGCVLIAASLILSIWLGAENPAVNYLGYTAIVCVIVFYAMNMMFWRCPTCHRPLPIFGPVLVCRGCKRKFMDEKGNQIW